MYINPNQTSKRGNMEVEYGLPVFLLCLLLEEYTCLVVKEHMFRCGNNENMGVALNEWSSEGYWDSPDLQDFFNNCGKKKIADFIHYVL